MTGERERLSALYDSEVDKNFELASKLDSLASHNRSLEQAVGVTESAAKEVVSLREEAALLRSTVEALESSNSAIRAEMEDRALEDNIRQVRNDQPL